MWNYLSIIKKGKVEMFNWNWAFSLWINWYV